MDRQPNILDYFDYRQYLEDYYLWKKACDPHFSHRVFLTDAGISGSVYLHRILKHQRKLSDTFLPNFIRALKLKGTKATYFSILVRFCNEKPGPKKDTYLQDLLHLRSKQPAYRIQNQMLRFYEKWYYPIIRELVITLDFKEDYNMLANHVVPRITPVQAKGAVEYLLRNGFIQKTESEDYIQTNPVISTGDEVHSTILRKYHRNMLEQCIDALDTIPPEKRDITSLTMSVSKENYYRIKKEIQQFRKHLLAIANEPQDPEIVCQTGFQLIPRSKLPNDTGEL